MHNNKFFQLIIYLGLIILFGCGSGNVEEIVTEPPISGEESARRAALERYRLMRLDALKHPEKYRRKRHYYVYRPKKVVPRRLPRKVDPEELKKEIEQNIAYYCIIHESDGKFENQEECRAHAKNVLEECENKKKLWNNNLDIVYCLKSQLKL